jgi:glutathione S-transferase
MGWEAPAERRAMLGFGSMDDVLNAIEGAVKDREFLEGEAFTAADLYLGALTWAGACSSGPSRRGRPLRPMWPAAPAPSGHPRRQDRRRHPDGG